MKIDIITLFPEFFGGVFSHSIIKRAVEAGKVTFNLHNLREYTVNKHNKADDYRFGGGAGMLLKPGPFFRVMDKIMSEASVRPLVVYPSPQGEVFSQPVADDLAKEQHLVFICGHYKGIDQRVIDRWVDRQYSLGDYVITGGEAAVTVISDAVIRMIPGTLGNLDSALTDSFRGAGLDCPHYTRPESFEGKPVPQVLLNGNHKNIDLWRKAVSGFLTKKIRPDLTNNSFGENNGKLERNS